MELAKMTLEEKVGQTLILGFTGSDLKAHEYEKVIQELKPAGFRLNPVYDAEGAYKPGGAAAAPTKPMRPQDYAELLEQLQQISLKSNGRRLFFCLDQEGGATSNFNRGAALFPFPMGYGMCLDAKDAEDQAFFVGRQLLSIGINLVHGPVVDINVNPKNPGIGVRSYHSKTEVVTEFGKAALRGFRRAGIIASVKHLPGKGDVEVDTHYEAVVIPQPLETMMSRELAPFKALVDSGAEVLMTSHAIVPSFGDDKLPFTISQPGIDIIREKLGFKGVLETDHILMEGLAKLFPVEELAVRCLLAGNDLVLFKLSPFAERLKVRDAVLNAVKEERIPLPVLDAAVERVLRLKEKYNLLKPGRPKTEDPAGWLQNKQVMELTRNHHRRMCVVSHNKGLLPLTRPGRVALVEVCNPYCKDSAGEHSHQGMLKEVYCRYGRDFQFMGFTQKEIDGNRESVLAKVKSADLLVVTCFTRAFDQSLAFARECCKHAKKSLLITFSPYHAGLVTEATAAITTFSDALPGIEAALAMAFGKAEAGKIKRPL
jgi:beta-N-acetylhexosaminidase